MEGNSHQPATQGAAGVGGALRLAFLTPKVLARCLLSLDSPPEPKMFKGGNGAAWLILIPSVDYHLVMTNSLPWKDPPIFNR